MMYSLWGVRRCATVLMLVAWGSLGLSKLQPARAADAPAQSRIKSAVNEAQRVVLTGNTHPFARPDLDRGPADSSVRLDRVLLLLQRSAEQARALAAFNERQHDPFSPDYHRWLDATEFGRLYGPSDADIAVVISWLKKHGLAVGPVNAGKVSLEFSGTVAQLQGAFSLQMHRYLVDGVEHLANDRDPQIPRALAPVVNGIVSLHDFRPTPSLVAGRFVKRNLATGRTTDLESGTARVAKPDLGYTGSDGLQHEDLTPYDFATIYNALPLWQAATPVNGSGVRVAIAAGSDIVAADITTFRKAFGLPAKAPTIVHNGADPGLQADQMENTLDVEMAGAAAPGADVTLVVSAGTATTWGFALSMQYIVSHVTAPIMSASYATCELNLQQSGNAFFNDIEQQGATEGISIFVASGDEGSAGCDSNQPSPDYLGLAVSGMASTPYVTAVGGTDFTWSFTHAPVSVFWNAIASAQGATARGYIPEMPWNASCGNSWLLGLFKNPDDTPQFASSEVLCNQASQSSSLYTLTGIEGGSGGASNCTSPTSNIAASCAGGYTKPAWQTGAGVPADGRRDVPDLALFSAAWSTAGIEGSAILFCMSGTGTNSCDYHDPDNIVFQEVGGTSAASPYMAGVMALVLQKTGVKQGLANPTFYKLAARDVAASCKAASVKSGNACVFYDTTAGTNAQPCVSGGPSCATTTSGDQIGLLRGYAAGTGYDLATGLGSVNVTNLVNEWASVTAAATLSLSPVSLTFAATTVGATSAPQVVTLKNTGAVVVSLTAAGISFMGTDAASFSKTATTCGTSVAVGSTCTVSVAFRPTVAGRLEGALTLADSAAGSPQAVALAGTAVSGGAAAGAATLTVAPASIAFPATAAGAVSAVQVVTLKNTGSAAASLKSFTLTGQADDFVLAKTCGATLEPGATCTLSLRFSPVSAGAKSGGLTIAGSGTRATVSVSLTGTGSATGKTGNPPGTPSGGAISMSATSLLFATTAAHSAAAAQTVTLKNTGSAAVTFNSFGLSGQADDFVLTKTCGATLSAGASCTLSVRFVPVSAGVKAGALTIVDTGKPAKLSVALQGTGK